MRNGSESGEGQPAGPRRATSAQRERTFEKSKDVEGRPRCEYCGREITKEPGRPNSYEADHQQPYSRGGPTTDENLAPSCRTCNRAKGSKTPEEFSRK
ncbi:MAG: HNH endonuclease [Byssovorax sp.]